MFFGTGVISNIFNKNSISLYNKYQGSYLLLSTSIEKKIKNNKSILFTITGTPFGRKINNDIVNRYFTLNPQLVLKMRRNFNLKGGIGLFLNRAKKENSNSSIEYNNGKKFVFARPSYASTSSMMFFSFGLSSIINILKIDTDIKLLRLFSNNPKFLFQCLLSLKVI